MYRLGVLLNTTLLIIKEVKNTWTELKTNKKSHLGNSSLSLLPSLTTPLQLLHLAIGRSLSLLLYKPHQEPPTAPFLPLPAKKKLEHSRAVQEQRKGSQACSHESRTTPQLHTQHTFSSIPTPPPLAPGARQGTVLTRRENTDTLRAGIPRVVRSRRGRSLHGTVRQ